MSTIYTDRFYFNRDSNTFSAEASDLGGLVPDSFRLRSQWTGRTVDVILTTSTRDREGDVLAWNYTVPEVENLKVVIYND